jgi:hypothetical protein
MPTGRARLAESSCGPTFRWGTLPQHGITPIPEELAASFRVLLASVFCPALDPSLPDRVEDAGHSPYAIVDRLRNEGSATTRLTLSILTSSECLESVRSDGTDRIERTIASLLVVPQRSSGEYLPI